MQKIWPELKFVCLCIAMRILANVLISVYWVRCVVNKLWYLCICICICIYILYLYLYIAMRILANVLISVHWVRCMNKLWSTAEQHLQLWSNWISLFLEDCLLAEWFLFDSEKKWIFTEWDVWTNFGQQLNSTSSSYDPTLGALWFFGGQTFCVTKYLIFDCPKNLANFAWREVWINSSYDPTFTTLGPHSPILIYFVC